MRKNYFRSKNYSQFEENCQRSTFFIQTYSRKNPDDKTELFEWKVSPCEMGNGALNTLVHQLIDNHLINEEKGMTLTF